MLALAVTFSAFAAWSTIGLALLAAIGADTRSLRLVLTAPALGSALTVCLLFVLSNAGLAMEHGALPLVVVVLVASVAVLAWRRPRLPLAAAPVAALCLVDLVFLGRPMLEFGFGWIANANDDMANYVLSATRLVHHGLLAPLDVWGVAHDRNYSSALGTLMAAGVRPGADITLGAFSSVTGRSAYELFMPLILSFNLCTVAAVGALAMQASRRWWAATLAAALYVTSPLAAYGVFQQLLPQVWGLGLAAALFALAMRTELYVGRGAPLGRLLPVVVLTAAFVIVYIELAAALALCYVLYVAVLAARRRISVRALAILFAGATATTLVALNSYALKEFKFLLVQVGSGASGTRDAASLFGFALIPSVLPAVAGLDILSPAPTRILGLEIAGAIVLLAITALASVLTARRGVAAAVALVTNLALGIVLGVRSADFGVFKLYMYVQPFIAAAVAVWAASLRRRVVLAAVGVVLALLMVAQLRTATVYSDRSRNPVDLPHASQQDLLPLFRAEVARTTSPMISVTENPALGKLEAVTGGTRPVYFLSRNFFQDFFATTLNRLHDASVSRRVRAAALASGWTPRSFDLPGAQGRSVNRFQENMHASTLLRGGACRIAIPTGSQLVVNRWWLPEGSPDIEVVPCRGAKNLLVFTVSNLGESFYLPAHRRDVSFYQLQGDYFYPAHTFSGFGRYALFRLLNPAPSVRLEVDVTSSLQQDGVNRLPLVAAIGRERKSLPIIGRGSARVFSPRIPPQMIAGVPYLMLDMGQDGRLPVGYRTGLAALYGRSVVADPRYLTAYVRDVSLVSEAEYRRLRPPAAVGSFPAGLANRGLEYSGIYEDGWVAEDSYAVLAGGRAATLAVSADVLGLPRQRLRVFVNGHQVAARKTEAGLLKLRVAIPSSRIRRRVELRWAVSARLPAPDSRPASARLSFLGVVPRTEG